MANYDKKEINIQETFKTQKSQKINDENNLNLEARVSKLQKTKDK